MTLLDGIDVGRKVADEVVLGKAAEAQLVDDEIRQRRRWRCVTAEGGDRLALVEPERSDVDESDDVRRVRAERGHDLPAIGVPHEDGRPAQPSENLPQPCDVVGKAGLRELRRGDLVALGLQKTHDIHAQLIG